MHALLFPIGSYGDVHPYVGLGLALKERGHRVTCFVCPYFRDLFERTGLEFVETGTTEQYLAAVANPELWHPRRGFRTVFENGIAPNFRRQFELIAERHVGGETVVLTSCMGIGARIAEEELGVPLVSVHLQPSVLWSDHASPKYAGMVAWPGWLRRFQFRVGERFLIDPVVKRYVDPFLRQLGRRPVSRTVRWWHSRGCNLCLFPEWFGPRQPDWPAGVTYAGFPLWDESAIEEVDPTVDEFLASGDPPIVFTPGSANSHARDFFAAAAAACRSLGRRGLLLSKFPEQIPADLPGTVRHFSYVPFAHAFARSAAVVHHGGIGTTAQCLRAGLPQLVMPMSHDQPDNAVRLERLGVGDWLDPRRFTARRVTKRLSRLLGSADVTACCTDLASRLDTESDALDRACSAIEDFARDVRPVSV